MTKYYDGTKLLSMLDINGNKPEIYMCTTNRTAGKTTYFGRLCINRFLDKGEKFGLLYRYNYELDDIVDKFYKDLGSLFFPSYTMTSKRRAKGTFQELFLNDKSPLIVFTSVLFDIFISIPHFSIKFAATPTYLGSSST